MSGLGSGWSGLGAGWVQGSGGYRVLMSIYGYESLYNHSGGIAGVGAGWMDSLHLASCGVAWLLRWKGR